MAEREDPKNGLANAAARAGTLVRKLPTARRLLVATIGAATVQFLAGCGNSSVANLMAAPDVPQSGQGGRGGPGGQGGRAGQGGQGGRGGNAGFYVSNLMAPPFVPDSGTGGTGGSGGSGGAAPDMDAGTDDDAGQA